MVEGIMDLLELARGYLEAEGYSVGRRGRDILVGSKASLAGEHQFFYVAVPDLSQGVSFRSQEGPLLARLKEINDQHPAAQKVVLVPTREGLSQEFLRGAPQWYNATIRVPVQFFDTAFLWEEAPGAARSAVDRLRTDGHDSILNRTYQPCQAVAGPPLTNDVDLLEVLFERLRKPLDSQRSVHIVIGPAGMGKSYLFQCLFARLHEAFLVDKRRQEMAPRPFALLPEYLPFAEGPSVKSLLRAYLQADMVRSLEPRVLEWMLGQGFAVLMLDGLDEVIDRDPLFFNYVEDLLTMPGSAVSPRLLICVRDSLLATSAGLRDFREECSAYLSIYKLDPWGEKSKKQFARQRLAARGPEFVDTLKSSTALDELASTAYYCDLLALQFELGQLSSDYSESDLLRDAVQHIIRRDYAKPGALDKSVLTEDVVDGFAEALATVDFERGFRGVPMDDAYYWAQLSLPAGLSPDDQQKLENQLVKMALFSYGGLGHLRFAQEVIELFLLGRWLTHLLDRRPEVFATKLATMQLPRDSVATRTIAQHVRAESKVTVLLDLAHQAQHRPTVFKNLVQLIGMAPNSRPEILKHLMMERKDLSGLTFSGLDFSDVSFRGCDLSNTIFDTCNLRGVNFSDAVLRATRFHLRDPDALRGAEVGTLAGLYSIVVDGGRAIESHAEVAKWFASRTAKGVESVGPCGTALQIRHIFGKYIYPNGQARRNWHGHKALVSGTRYIDNAVPLVAALVRYGYMSVDGRGMYYRAEGDLYAEMRTFVMSLSVSPNLSALMAEQCPTDGCSHGGSETHD